MPEWDRPFVAAAAKKIRLSLNPRRRREGQGNRLGAGPGASLEFHDHRHYTPGDDLRHLDWGVYARSDQLMIRRYRQEVSPRVEIIADCSASMAVSPGKAQMLASMVALLVRLAHDAGSHPVLWTCTDSIQRLDGEHGWARQTFAGRGGLDADPAPQLRPGGDRFLVSDGLTPRGGAQTAARLGREAGRLALIQILTQQEADPQPLGAVRLEDVEGGAMDLVHDEATCAAYRKRFDRHQEGWRSALRGRGAGLVTCIVEDGNEAALGKLLANGVCEVTS